MKKQEKKKITPIKKVIQITTTVILIASTLLCFVTVVSSAFGKEASIFGFRLFYVATGSMEPTLPVGTLLIVRPCDEYKVDDIITFYSREDNIEGRPNTHRIVGTIEVDGELQYLTRGDANNTPDTLPVPQKDVIGKVYFDIHMVFIKDVIGFLSTPMGFFFIILVPVLYVAIVCMKNFKDVIKVEMRRIAEKEINSESIETETKENSDNETEGNNTTE